MTTPTTPKASGFSGTAGTTGAQSPWKTVARPNVAPPDMRKSVLKAMPSHVGGLSMVSQMRGLSVNNSLLHPGAANPNVHNPSLGPLPPTGTQWGGTAVQTDMTTDTYFKPVKTPECVRTKRTVRDFKSGEVLALPFHVANMNPKLVPNHPRLQITCEGPAFSKRRMFIVLWINQIDMFCLPLYSFEGKGLAAKKDYLKADYVCLANKEAGRSFKNVGLYKPVVFESYDRKPLTDETTVHLTGGVTVDPREHITYVGRLTKDSHAHLLQLWQDRVDIAQDKAWVPTRR
ncbi:unnamed protein product [Zymoseptoria tritici ST99CH_1E4]|uniref:DUF6590 domain-containing protein n=1 Tax=Zymoseptoria tritici ST99CH_1E4 TaxID=1276532 RepID=A0A2H1GCA4_ZYMTR|nr:unnamed protein product [Zymoseptoria tritici ST99CH_1E4]